MGLKMAKNVPKIAYVGVFCHFRPLRGIKTLQQYFYLVEEVASIWWVICKNLLKIGFRNEYFPSIFSTKFPAAFPADDLHILKISR